MLGYTYIDTGAMYRAVTLYFQRNHIDLHNERQVATALSDIVIRFQRDPQTQQLRTILNNEDVEAAIRTPEVAGMVSPVAAISAVRKAMVAQQQEMGRDKGVVMDGRDIGTVVFPDAECKFFMTAEYDIRTRRRVEELAVSGIRASFEDVKANLLERDHIDSTREDSPLKKAADAIEIDTSYITTEEQIDRALSYVRQVIAQPAISG